MAEFQQLRVNGQVAVPRCGVARDFFGRFLGLMGRASLGDDEGLLFPDCNSVHTFFMRFPIDVVCIDEKGQVLHVAESVRPWGLVLPKRGIKHILELKGGRAKQLGFQTGARLECSGVWA